MTCPRMVLLLDARVTPTSVSRRSNNSSLTHDSKLITPVIIFYSESSLQRRFVVYFILSNSLMNDCKKRDRPSRLLQSGLGLRLDIRIHLAKINL